MDGIDGLVSGCMLVIFITLSFLGFKTLLPLIASLSIFLFWNWSPSKLFMGDSGSTYLGGIFFGYLLQIKDLNTLFAVLIISSPLMGDAFICVIRRFLAKKDIFSAHRSHLYQRLNRAGFSHSKVSLIYILATLLLSISFLLGGLKFTLLFGIIEFFVLCYIDKKFAIKFSNS